MITKAILLPAADCDWSGCGQPAPVEVLVTIHGEPARFACPLGCYCVGHAVITGIDAQARYGGGLWYQPRPPMAGHVTTVSLAVPALRRWRPLDSDLAAGAAARRNPRSSLHPGGQTS
jgi:hypothetical protein